MDRRRNLMAEIISGGGMEMTDFELVGTKDITVPTSEVVFEFSKPCKELVIVCDNMQAENDSQIIISANDSIGINGINTELSKASTTHSLVVFRCVAGNILQFRRSGTYKNTIMSPSSINFTNTNVAEVNKIKVFTQYSINMTAGNIKIYGR